MSIEQEVRAALADRADQVDSTPLWGAALRQQAAVHRRRAVRRNVVTVVMAAAAVAAVLVAPAILRRESLPPASSTVDTWPTRGDLASDVALAAAARRAWEAAPVLPGELPHREVRVVAAVNTAVGRYVMLTGLNALGHRRLAVFSDDPRDSEPYERRLRLRSDKPFPDDDDLLTYLEPRQTGQEQSALLLVVGPPDVTRVRWRDQFETWRELSAPGGIAKSVVATGYPELRIRAYRGTKRVAQERVGSLRRDLYDPDEALLEAASDDSTCHDGVCTATAGGSVSVQLPGPGDLAGVHRPDDKLWEDMAEQGEQLWFNWALGERRLSSSGSGGLRLSALLPDDTGVHLSVRQVNGLPDQLVLYVDRPEWALGRLYLAKPIDPANLPLAVTALVPGADGANLVVFAGTGVGVRYRVGAGAWRVLAIDDGIGTAVLGNGVQADAVEVEATFDGRTYATHPASSIASGLAGAGTAGP